MTASCCLGERLMNRLVIKLRDYFKTSEHYKRAEKIQNWQLLIRILADWNIFSTAQAQIAEQLRRLRSDSVHYVHGFDFQTGAKLAMGHVIELVNSTFSAFARKDIFRVFEIPGEIWVRAEAEDAPFVKEFVLPSCTRMAATFFRTDDGYVEHGATAGQISENEFMRIRTEFNQEWPSLELCPAKRIEKEVNGEMYVFVVP